MPTQKHRNEIFSSLHILAIIDESTPPDRRIPKGSLGKLFSIDFFKAAAIFCLVPTTSLILRR